MRLLLSAVARWSILTPFAPLSCLRPPQVRAGASNQCAQHCLAQRSPWLCEGSNAATNKARPSQPHPAYPAAVVTAGPSSLTNSATATFAFEARDGSPGGQHRQQVQGRMAWSACNTRVLGCKTRLAIPGHSIAVCTCGPLKHEFVRACAHQMQASATSAACTSWWHPRAFSQQIGTRPSATRRRPTKGWPAAATSSECW